MLNEGDYYYIAAVYRYLAVSRMIKPCVSRVPLPGAFESGASPAWSSCRRVPIGSARSRSRCWFAVERPIAHCAANCRAWWKGDLPTVSFVPRTVVIARLREFASAIIFFSVRLHRLFHREHAPSSSERATVTSLFAHRTGDSRTYARKRNVLSSRYVGVLSPRQPEARI